MFSFYIIKYGFYCMSQLEKKIYFHRFECEQVDHMSKDYLD